jgi:hypothetical protein
MNRAEKRQVFAGWIAFTPYLLVAWGLAEFADDLSFWLALAILLGVRAAFGVIEIFGGVLVWRLYGRSRTIDELVEFFRANKLPPRTYRSDGIGSYLARIEDPLVDLVEPADVALARRVRELQQMRQIHEHRGVLAGMRINSALEAALERYAPAVDAPELTFDNDDDELDDDSR